eukprot:922262-Pelagomonas_calceolata.AAC.9
MVLLKQDARITLGVAQGHMEEKPEEQRGVQEGQALLQQAPLFLLKLLLNIPKRINTASLVL